jgi:hypothetical protein
VDKTVSIEELDALCEDYIKHKALEEEAKKTAKDAAALTKEKEKAVIQALEALDRAEYSGPFGKLGITQRRYYKMADKDQVFRWLKEKGDFEDLATVNAQTFSSYCKQLIDDKRSQGDFVWQPPGVEDATSDYTYLRYKP